MPAFFANIAFQRPDGCWRVLLTNSDGLHIGTMTLDANDWRKVKAFRWSLDKEGYPRNNRAGGRLHKVLLGTNGFEKIVDHFNGDKLDNRRINLMVVSQSVNNHHRAKKKNNKSGAVGVIWIPRINAWMAYIGADRKRHHIGYFKDKAAAIAARDKKATELFGICAYRNDRVTAT